MNDLSDTAFSKFVAEPQIPARFSVEEYEQMQGIGLFDGSKVELVEGVLVRMNAAKSHHTALQKQIYDKLGRIFRDGLNGYHAYFEYGVRFAVATLRAIDVAVAGPLPSEDRFTDGTGILLAIEISINTLRYDLDDKRLEYARSGISHYWVVDPVKQAVHVMWSPIDGDYAERHRAAFGEVLKVPGTGETITVDPLS